jgi:hypothetical protein
VLPILSNYVIATFTLVCKMFRARFDTFSLVVNFLDERRVLRHVIVGLFETFNIVGGTLTKIVKPLVIEF